MCLNEAADPGRPFPAITGFQMEYKYKCFALDFTLLNAELLVFVSSRF